MNAHFPFHYVASLYTEGWQTKNCETKYLPNLKHISPKLWCWPLHSSVIPETMPPTAFAADYSLISERWPTLFAH